MNNSINNVSVGRTAFRANFSPAAEKFISDRIAKAGQNKQYGAKIAQQAENLKHLCEKANPFAGRNDITFAEDYFFFSGGNKPNAPYETCLILSEKISQKYDDWAIIKILSDLLISLEKINPKDILKKIGISLY